MHSDFISQTRANIYITDTAKISPHCARDITAATPHGMISFKKRVTGFQIKYIALSFEAVRKSTDLADGLTRFFEESKGVLLSGRDANSP